MSDNDFSNPLTRRTPLGGRTGVAIASLVPLLAIPVAGVIIYGLGARPNR